MDSFGGKKTKEEKQNEKERQQQELRQQQLKELIERYQLEDLEELLDEKDSLALQRMARNLLAFGYNEIGVMSIHTEASS